MATIPQRGRIIIQGGKIEGNCGTGLILDGVDAEIDGAKIQHNGRDGVEARGKMALSMRDTDVIGNKRHGILFSDRTEAHDAVNAELDSSAIPMAERNEIKELVSELYRAEKVEDRKGLHDRILARIADYATIAGLISPYLAVLVGV